ncbi:MAG: hypothetical protein ACYDH0_13280 [Candidatus Aminicenantales bacterium]
MKAKVFVTVGIFAFLALMSVYGQQSMIKATLDFPFMVGNKTLPAGPYEFVRDADAQSFAVRGGNTTAVIGIITRFARELHTTPQDAHVVFDVVGGTYMLSEIVIPGEDGYMLLATKEKHEHKVMNIKF